MAASRRLYLSVTLKLMALFAAGVAFFILLSALGGPETPPETKTVTLSVTHLVAGKPELVDWEGKPILLLARSEPMRTALLSSGQRLVDPTSSTSHQPPAAANVYRSLRPELFVTLARGTLIGCPLEYVAADSGASPIANWQGGFHEQCSDAWYDLAGRAYRHGTHPRNLVIPPHHYDAQGRLVIGSNE